VRTARGRAADEQRDREPLPLHLARHVGHLVERGRDEAREPDHVGRDLLRLLEDLLARDHDAHVDDLVVVAREHDADDVLADVVHVALHRREHDLALRFLQLSARGGLGLLGLHEGLQIRDALFHHAGAFHDLRQEHFACAEEIADDAHAVHERAFDDEQRLAELVERLLVSTSMKVGDAFEQRVFERRFSTGASRHLEVGFDLLAAALGLELLA
jgi:hypothetical protein